jgi:hypothetical protein
MLPPELQFTSTDFNSNVTTSIAEVAPQRINARILASAQPSLSERLHESRLHSALPPIYPPFVEDHEKRNPT